MSNENNAIHDAVETVEEMKREMNDLERLQRRLLDALIKLKMLREYNMQKNKEHEGDNEN